MAVEHDRRSLARGAGPAWIVNAALVVALGVTVILIVAARRLPALPFELEVAGDRIVVASSKAEVTALRTHAQSASFQLQPIDLVEEPDIAGSWEELDAFYARQGELWSRLQAPTVEVRVDGAWRSVAVEQRTLGELPLAFFTLLGAALVVWVLGFLTYALSDRGLAARIYMVSAVAFSVAVWPAALYATRPIAIEPGAFHLLSTADHAGALIFAAGVIGILVVYPVRLLRSISWLWITAVIAAIAGHFQWGDMSLSGFYTANVIQFILFLGFATWQWRAARRQPLQRAALGWMLLSMFVGVIFFLTLITLPVLLGSGPTISQTTGLVSIVFMYAGISLGVLRFRLFDLDRWWFRTWSWILSGAVVVGVDLMLTQLFHVTQNVALVVALVVVGWIYFPVRQHLTERFSRTARPAAYDARDLIGAATIPDLHACFREALRSSFSPLEIVETGARIEAPRLTGDGAWLEVPSPASDATFRCHFRAGGARLFARDDVARATDLVTLGDSVRLAIDAREEGQVAERARIRRDLHDDLGASIIRIVHETTDEQTARLAQDAMRDLRDVLTALHDTPTACQDLLEDLEAELRARAQANGHDIEWSIAGTTDHVLSARSCANVTRALRESMTNALRHGSGTIRYAFELGRKGLRATISNGADGEAPIEPGLGLGNIVSRLTELGGSASFARSDGRFALTLGLPWSAEP